MGSSESSKTFQSHHYLRVESGSRVLNLLDQSGHVLQEEIVEVLLLHVLQFEGLFLASTDHDDGETF